MSASNKKRVGREFFCRDVLEVAPDLLGKMLVIGSRPDNERKVLITETEAYRGEEDKACHASRGRTARTEIMYSAGGHIYMYLIYGIHWMLNIVTSVPGTPQAVLIRGIEGFNGPGKLTRELGVDKSYYGIDMVKSSIIWIEDTRKEIEIIRTPRVGINYADSLWRNKQWRYVAVINNK